MSVLTDKKVQLIVAAADIEGGKGLVLTDGDKIFYLGKLNGGPFIASADGKDSAVVKTPEELLDLFTVFFTHVETADFELEFVKPSKQNV